MKTWIVTWKKKGYALPFLIDFDDETAAIKCGVALNEVGRYDVSITASEWEPDQEAMKRIRERVFARKKEIPAVFA